MPSCRSIPTVTDTGYYPGSSASARDSADPSSSLRIRASSARQLDIECSAKLDFSTIDLIIKRQDCHSQPAVLPPPGQLSDLGSPNPFYHATIAITIVLVLVSTTSLAARLFTQLSLSDGLAPEDYIVIVAWACINASTILSIPICNFGFGKDAWDIASCDYFKIAKYFYFLNLVSIAGSVLTYTAILLQFIRIFAPFRIDRPTWITCWICLILNVLLNGPLFFVEAFQCKPIDALWNASVEDYTCISFEKFWMACIATEMVLNLVLVIVPSRVILRLKMDRARKVTTLVIFATGIISCIAAILDLYYLLRLNKNPSSGSLSFWQSFWVQIEQHVNLVLYCLAVAPKFVAYVGKKSAEWLAHGDRLRTDPSRQSSSAADRTMAVEHSRGSQKGDAIMNS